MDNNLNKCPGCSRHCDLNNLQCGKGEAILRGEESSARPHNHNSSHHHGGKHHGHRRPEFPEGSLAQLISSCAHRLFHGDDERMFDVLTAEEQAELRRILKKLN